MSENIEGGRLGDEGRRGFLALIFLAINGAMGLLLGVPVLSYLLRPLLKERVYQEVEVGDLEEFSSEEPRRKRIRYVSKTGYRELAKAENVWVTLEGNDHEGGRSGVVVFSSKCPHAGCNIYWRADSEQYDCPCHGGRFDKEGRVLGGPPPRPLTRLQSRVEDGKIIIEV